MVLRAAYHEALEALNADLARLGALLVDSTKCAITALRTGDVGLAARVVAPPFVRNGAATFSLAPAESSR